MCENLKSEVMWHKNCRRYTSILKYPLCGTVTRLKKISSLVFTQGGKVLVKFTNAVHFCCSSFVPISSFLDGAMKFDQI